jgi:RNA polymerase sigma factor (sigma-70 family)
MVQGAGELMAGPGCEVWAEEYREPRSADLPDEEERRWVERAREGDAAAFDRLVERHWRKIASVVSRFLSDPNDVEDAVQETFVRAFQGLRGFRGEASARTWLLRIAVNVCRNRHAEAWRRRVSLTEDDAALPHFAADARALAEAAILRTDRERALRSALRELPEKLRLPILLHFIEELSGAEVAQVLGWNESTVWSRIYAGCRALRRKLGPDWEA